MNILLQVDPFLVRYCPYQATDEGIYIVKVFAAIEARFYWELSWQVTVEATGETFRGKFFVYALHKLPHYSNYRIKSYSCLYLFIYC